MNASPATAGWQCETSRVAMPAAISASAATLPPFLARPFFRTTRWLALLIAGTLSLRAEDPPANTPAPSIESITNISQVLSHAQSPTILSLPVRLEGTVTEADPQRGMVDIVDDTDMARIEVDLKQIPMAAGQRIRLEGTVQFGNNRAVFENNRVE